MLKSVRRNRALCDNTIRIFIKILGNWVLTSPGTDCEIAELWG
jgi:hypothetical protein